MKRIAHLSDVHFGREDPALVEALLLDVAKAAPDVVVVSGDLTQRAKKRQFRAAREFLLQLPRVPQIVVPGNHDVSATNLVERALHPMLRFQKYICPDLAPFFSDEELAIAGINTVRTFKRKDGRINARQVRQACAQLATAAPAALRVVVTHHPMDLAENSGRAQIVRRAPMAMRSFAEAGVDLFLSGHLHVGAAMLSSATYVLPGWSALVVHAGTAVSTRTRETANAWNLLRSDVAGPGVAELTLEQRVWQGAAFTPRAHELFRKGTQGWARA